MYMTTSMYYKRFICFIALFIFFTVITISDMRLHYYQSKIGNATTQINKMELIVIKEQIEMVKTSIFLYTANSNFSACVKPSSVFVW